MSTQDTVAFYFLLICIILFPASYFIVGLITVLKDRHLEKRWNKVLVKYPEFANLIGNYTKSTQQYITDYNNLVAPKEREAYDLRIQLSLSTPREREQLYKEIDKLVEEIDLIKDELSEAKESSYQFLIPKINDQLSKMDAKELKLAREHGWFNLTI